eukprot:COSAG01_NODE_8498_length_2763_cov_1.614489_2_plen_376_part_00
MTIAGVWNTFNRRTSPGVCCGNHLTETIRNVQRTGIELEVERIDQPYFGQQIHVQWLACPRSSWAVETIGAHSEEADEHTEEEEEEEEDVYLLGFCNMLRCPTPGMQQNFGYALRTRHLGAPNCDRAWPGPLSPTPLVPRLRSDGAVVLAPQAISNDGIAAPQVTGELEVVLHCDPQGVRGEATPRNASLISSDPSSPLYVPYRLELTSRCACPGGCVPPPPPPPPRPIDSQSSSSGPPPPAALAPGATMPSDGSFIVRLQHLFGSAEALGELSEAVEVDLADLFCGVGQKIAEVQEMTLSANQKAEDVHHWHWRWQHKDGGHRAHRVARDRATETGTPHRVRAGGGVDGALHDHGTRVIMQPLSIRTFVVSVQR